MSEDAGYDELDGLGPDAVKKGALLAHYAEVGNLTQAAKLAGISRQRHYEWVKADPVYALKFADAQESAADALEAEARRRAVGGYDRDDDKGKVRGSDLLLIFLLKGARPWKYRDNAKPDAEANGADAPVLGWEQQQALSDLADAVLEEREQQPSS